MAETTDAVVAALGYDRLAFLLESRAASLRQMGGNLIMYGPGYAATDLSAASALRGATHAISLLTADNARLQSELAAMQADRDAAAEDERDRLYSLAVARVRQHIPGAVDVAGWLAGQGAEIQYVRAALRALAKQEPTA
ncbi:hypothetical protein [Aureimonas glaciei]|uniref:Uncharacterized protein n=1 Tax=Aureimonas glaciei TaxID=1776957 RepID=A0A916XUI9_9HYPH|nr:hypothetical protein [Aureimonas glaciei]GGD11769.1 hypothetical protein GCM10011335_13440 [Aureimonas glaciei]